MQVFRGLTARIKTRQMEKYIFRLLCGKIRLQDVPDWLLQDYNFCTPIYIAAFRADEISRTQYAEDLNFLGVQIVLAEVGGCTRLHTRLKDIYERSISDFEYHPEIFKNN